MWFSAFGFSISRPLDIRNCVVSQNHSADGTYGAGGVYNSASSGVSFENCTVVNNASASAVGGILSSWEPMVRNCILWGNSGAQLASEVGTGIVAYCCIEGWTNGGVGIITTDPLLDDEWNLTAGSSCIDAGTNLTWMTNAYDLDGVPRLRLPTVEMGCYELPDPIRPGIGTNRLEVSDDGYTHTGENTRHGEAGYTPLQNPPQYSMAVTLGFSVNFFGSTNMDVFVNNNGNLTFDSVDECVS